MTTRTDYRFDPYELIGYRGQYHRQKNYEEDNSYPSVAIPKRPGSYKNNACGYRE